LVRDLERDLQESLQGGFRSDLPVAQLWTAYQEAHEHNTKVILAAGAGMGVAVAMVFM
jgi:hypothetical protein